MISTTEKVKGTVHSVMNLFSFVNDFPYHRANAVSGISSTIGLSLQCYVLLMFYFLQVFNENDKNSNNITKDSVIPPPLPRYIADER